MQALTRALAIAKVGNHPCSGQLPRNLRQSPPRIPGSATPQCHNSAPASASTSRGDSEAAPKRLCKRLSCRWRRNCAYCSGESRPSRISRSSSNVLALNKTGVQIAAGGPGCKRQTLLPTPVRGHRADAAAHPTPAAPDSVPSATSLPAAAHRLHAFDKRRLARHEFEACAMFFLPFSLQPFTRLLRFLVRPLFFLTLRRLFGTLHIKPFEYPIAGSAEPLPLLLIDTALESHHPLLLTPGFAARTWPQPWPGADRPVIATLRPLAIKCLSPSDFGSARGPRDAGRWRRSAYRSACAAGVHREIQLAALPAIA
jgi:hypothetical protein